MTARLAASRPAAVCRGIVSLLALLILLAGVPAALLAVAGSPVPHAMPTWSQVTTTLSQQDNGTLFLGAVRLITWLAWAAFAIATITEIVSQVRGRPARRLPGLGGMQRLAARLITSVAVAFAAGTPAAFAAVPTAAPVATAAAPGGVGGHLQIVKPVDTLSQIAEADLGNWHQYQEIFRDSQKLPQPDGYRLTSPELIYPGERLWIPGPASPAAHPCTQSPAAGDAPARAVQIPAGNPSAVVTPTGPARAAPQGAAHDGHASIPVSTIAGYGALLASVTLNILTLKRRIQQRHRKPRRRIKLPAKMSESEQAIRTIAEPGSVELLDGALRSMLLQVKTTQPQTLPSVTVARITGSGIELHLAEPAGAVAPFTEIDSTTWCLDAATSGLPPSADLRDVPAPYPALVTFGDDRSGGHVLVDLVNVGAISLLGDVAHASEVLTALAMEMAASPWADFITIHCVGFGAELPRLIGTGRLRHADDIESVLADMTARATEVDQALAESGANSVPDARSRGIAGDAWAPEIIMSAIPVSADQLVGVERIVSLGNYPDGVSLAAIIAAADGESALPGPWQLDATPGHAVLLPVIGTEITLQRVTADQYQQLVGDLDIASDKDSVIAPEPDHPETSYDPSAETAPSAEIEIRVLGPVEIVGRDVADIESGKRNLLPELAAYLRLNPGRSAEEVSKAMGGPRGPWAPATRASNMSRLRAWLGRDSEGRNYVPALGEGRLYRLADSVACDWDQFRKLARRSLADPSPVGTDTLCAALQLVRGEPFASAPPHSYIWAEFTRQEMISTITDVAHELAARLTKVGDPAGARSAIARGLEVEPGSELLYRDLFRAEHRAGNAAGIEEAAERLMLTLAELDLDMEPETADLLNHLRGHRSSAAQARTRS